MDVKTFLEKQTRVLNYEDYSVYVDAKSSERYSGVFYVSVQVRYPNGNYYSGWHGPFPKIEIKDPTGRYTLEDLDIETYYDLPAGQEIVYHAHLLKDAETDKVYLVHYGYKDCAR